MAETQAGAGKARPLSPHLHIYRWTITMAASVAHRLSGIALGAGTLLLSWWLYALADGAQAYGDLQIFLAGWPGRVLLLGFTWSLMFHMCNGVRHLAWDTGRGFEIATANKTAWAVFAASVILTGGVWWLGYMMRGSL